MYAYQVIEELQKMMNSVSCTYYRKEDSVRKVFTEKDKQFYSTIHNCVRDSTKFHFGMVDNFMVRDKVYKFDNHLISDIENNIKLPFSICWFDYQVENKDFHGGVSKFGILSIDDIKYDKNIHFLTFAFTNEKWALLPSYTMIESDPEKEYFGKFLSNVFPVYKDMHQDDAWLDWWEQLSCSIFTKSISLLNCKNISTKKNFPSEKHNKKRIKKGKTPFFTYHTLVIKPTGSRQESTPKHLWDNRVHLCRGHFKAYTKENPLFGKYTGRYWWQPSVRGNKSKGVVLKDYKVEANAFA